MAKNKMVQCKHCGMEIAASAKACPGCGGKNKKPFYKRVSFWILIIFILIIVAALSCGGEDTSPQKVGEVNSNTNSQNVSTTESDNKKGESAEATESEEPAQTVYHVGDILQDGDLRIVYMASGEYKEDNEFLTPGAGNKYIFLQFSFENTSTSSDESISMFSFDAYADGYAVEMYYGGDDDLSGTLSAGRIESGFIYFEVPEDAEEIEIEYTTNYFTEDKITFVYDGDTDSGYVVPKNTTRAENAHEVGDVAESSNLNITYVSCFDDTSDNMFIEPKSGYHYITLEFEFENLGKSDEHITVWDFDCYADGSNCDQAYFRDDELSATISSGRKAKGTVTFEVPESAEVIEVEFLSNYWTSNRVVFTAK